jgi:hypothetical protein
MGTLICGGERERDHARLGMVPRPPALQNPPDRLSDDLLGFPSPWWGRSQGATVKEFTNSQNTVNLFAENRLTLPVNLELHVRSS